MRLFKGLICGLFLLSCCLVGQAMALGPVDGEFGAIWWENDYESTGTGSDLSSSASAPGFRGELWFLKRYGIRAAMFSSDVEQVGVEDSDYTSVDLMWKAVAPMENNFFAVGLGWTEMDLSSAGMAVDTSGARISVEGRVALVGLVYVYGQGSYLPELDDGEALNPLDGNFTDMTGFEYEAGVSVKMAPFLSLRAGYRAQKVDFTRVDLVGAEFDGDSESSGFLAGLTVRF
jgi:opacity protein-like surface antigen